MRSLRFGRVRLQMSTVIADWLTANNRTYASWEDGRWVEHKSRIGWAKRWRQVA